MQPLSVVPDSATPDSTLRKSAPRTGSTPGGAILHLQASTPTWRRRVFGATQLSQGKLWLGIICTGIAAALLLPLAYLLLRASNVGIGTALNLLIHPRSLQIFWNSVVLVVWVTGLSLALSIPLAWLTVRTDLPGKRIWSVLCALPLVIPSYVGAYALVAMMGPRGIVQGWLAPLGIERLPSIYGLPGAVWALTIFSFPYLFLSVRAGLQRLDPATEEAARSLGYGAWQTFWRVTLPSLRPSLAAGGLLVALYVLSDFGAVAILRFNSFTRAIYIQYLTSFDRSLASLLALVLVLVSIFLLFAAQRFQGTQRYYRAGTGVGRRQHEIELGQWKWPALALCLAVVSASLLMPTGVVVYWLVRGILAGESLQPVLQATLNSLQAATLAALACVLLAMPLAYLTARYSGAFSSWILRAVYVGNGLPAIVVAISLVFFGANYAPVLYQTLFTLLFAYVVRFLPEGLGTIRASLMQISPRMEEAARSLGLNRRAMIYKVLIPLLRPGLWAGFALVFLSTIKELPATLLLSPSGFSTLATQIWSATDEAFFTRAAAPSLILLTVSALSIFLILRQEADEA
ncbi:MAG: iron ABC transporter permease [Litorilinea sp.]